MSSLQQIRKKQIDEVLDADKNISRQVFKNTFRSVRQFQDTLKQPNPMEKKVSYEIEKFIIEMESMLTEIQNELSQELEPKQDELADRVGEPVIERENKEEEEEDDEPVEEEEKQIIRQEEQVPQPQLTPQEQTDYNKVNYKIALTDKALASYINRLEGLPDDFETVNQAVLNVAKTNGSLQDALHDLVNAGNSEDLIMDAAERYNEAYADVEDEIVDEERRLGLFGNGRRMKGGVKERKISLLEIWNKFVNYVTRLANLQSFTQNDIYVLYDRLDDLIPLLQNIINLNVDAQKVNVTPIAQNVVEIILSKIQNRDISPITPAKQLLKVSSQETSELQLLEKLKNVVFTRATYLKEKGDLETTIKKKEKRLKELMALDNPKKMQRDALTDIKNLLPILKEDLDDWEKRWKVSQQVGEAGEGISRKAIEKRISDIKRRTKYIAEPPIKASRQALRGEGKTAASQILKKYDDETYKVYTAIPSLSYQELEDLYLDLEDKKKFAQEHNDDKNWQKYNFLTQAILSDERAKDIQRMLGNGKKMMTDNKYTSTSMPLPYMDTKNELYSY